MALAPEALGQLTPRHASHRPAHPEPPARADLESLLALVKQHDGNGYLHALQQMAARQGLGQFVQDTVAPLTRQVGLAWEEGRFEVFEEHLFTEMTKRMLRQAIATLPAGSGAPRVLLTSLPGEEHILGLLMLEALLALEGAHCVPLGTEMPLTEISRAAAAHRADIVALSFSAAFPQRQIPPLLEQLRQSLPPGTALWIGGSGISRLPPMTGVLPLTDLKQGVAALNQWRGEKASAD